MAKHKWWSSFIPIYGIYPILDSLFGKGSIDGFLGNVVDAVSSISDKYTGSDLTNADVEAWKLNEQSSSNQRDWEAEQADIAYQRQREFFQDFQSPQAQVQQFQDAGLNPALMFQRGVTPASPVSGNQASGGASGRSPQPSTGDIGQLISLMANLSLREREVKADEDLKGSQADWNRKQIDLAGNRFVLEQQRFELDREIASKNFEDIDSRILARESENALRSSHIDKQTAEIALLNWQSQISQINAEYLPSLNDSLLELQKISRGKGLAETKLIYANTDKAKREYRELIDTYDMRIDKLQGEVISTLAKAGIDSNELYYWKDFKNLEAVSIQASIFADAKRKLPFGIEYTSQDALNFFGLNSKDGWTDVNPFMDPNTPLAARLLQPNGSGPVNGFPGVSSNDFLDIFDTYGGKSVEASKRIKNKWKKWSDELKKKYPPQSPWYPASRNH